MTNWVLNLSKGFGPSEQDVRGTEINYEYTVFPGGEPHIRLENYTPEYDETNHVIISHRIQSFNDLGKLLVSVDALRNIGNVSYITLILPYFPGARQDRVANSGEALTVKVYADIINSLNLNNVAIVDPHSDVTSALVNNVEVNNNTALISEVLVELNLVDTPCEINIVSPDSGANKKIKDLVISLSDEYPDHTFNIIKCDKTRDTKTGKITGFEVYTDSLSLLPTIIVDDICDGGGTFIGLAEELKKKDPLELTLVVTHGIFSKGFDDLNKYFRRIFTTDSFAGKRNSTVTEIKMHYGLH